MNKLLKELHDWLDEPKQMTRQLIKDKIIEIDTRERAKTKNISERVKNFPFREKLIEYGFYESLVDDWLKVRKTKKATNTKTAFNSIIREFERKNCDINEMLEIAITNSWSGFKHSWVEKLNNEKTNQNGTRQQPLLGRQSADTVRANASGWNDAQ